MKEVRIRFVEPEKSTIHRIPNFGEDLWRSFREEKGVTINLEEIDRAQGEIAYLVHSSFPRRSLTEVHRLLKVHFMENEVVVET
ncbi:hypothetical protein EB232_20585 [Mesorhizobium sp. NZP2077]|uniref:hypothetical protein n=1 Tax=Mesorhizobium sp. NZP2077 TaxID=2483404 RepID=UPI001555351A|nr:hypothetical protein [Mesorhizobium sp. NZP2077]QKC83672.1 hypothetical protein EB232_20585 [Mesorhizobium sp. NZP2077]QKD17196.1 hypothetical protein HGP13_20305 [Mesorhizobium sp. NZP2077]